MSENGACMGMPVFPPQKKNGKMDDHGMIHKILGCPIFRPKSGMLGHPVAKFRRRFKQPLAALPGASNLGTGGCKARNGRIGRVIQGCL